jgi:hypothetical protein
MHSDEEALMLVAGLALFLLGLYTHNFMLWIFAVPIMLAAGLRLIFKGKPGSESDKRDEPNVPRMWRG